MKENKLRYLWKLWIGLSLLWHCVGGIQGSFILVCTSYKLECDIDYAFLPFFCLPFHEKDREEKKGKG